MNLVLDFGNTRLKFGVFDHLKMVHKGFLQPKDLTQGLRNLLDQYKNWDRAIWCQVGPVPDKALEVIKSEMNIIEMTTKVVLPIKNQYKTPHSIGLDRLALASAAHTHFPNNPVLVIDCGTCVTYDFVDVNGCFVGGAISPGLKMRYKAMNTNTHALPELHPQRPSGWYGASTEASLHHGAFLGLIHEIDGFIDQYGRHNPDLTVILTGGDHEILRDHIKNDIFAHPNFLLLGLNQILLLNSKD